LIQSGGRKWVLLPHVVEVKEPAKANVFEIPGGYAVVVGLAGAAPSVPVTVRQLRLEGFKAEVVVPGETNWKPIPVTFTRNPVHMDVPLRRGAASVRFVRMNH